MNHSNSILVKGLFLSGLLAISLAGLEPVAWSQSPEATRSDIQPEGIEFPAAVRTFPPTPTATETIPPATVQVAMQPELLAAPPLASDGIRPIRAVTASFAPPTLQPGVQRENAFPRNDSGHLFREESLEVLSPSPWTSGPAWGDVRWSYTYCHRPLYFEEANVERYGYSWGILQPAVSAARFYSTIPALPYRMMVEPPGVCMLDRHPYPAGMPAPRERELPPADIRAGLVEAATIVGLIALFP